MRVIGLDLGTRCGYAWTDRGQVIGSQSGTWDLHNHKVDGAGMRFLRFESRLRDLIADIDIGERVAVFFEIAPPMAPSRKNTGNSSRELYGGFSATLQRLCEELAVPYAGVRAAVVKKTATGKGNANKLDMVRAANLTFGTHIEEAENDQADALWVLQTGLDDLKPEGWAP